MTRIFTLLVLPLMAIALPVSVFKRHAVLEKEIQGDWLAAEYYMAQPPPELQQPIKSISLEAGNVIKWTYIQDGKLHKATGSYGIYSSPKDQEMSRELLKLIVAPANYNDAAVPDKPLLILSDVELDYDSRFIQSWGKLLKARDVDGKRILFIRKIN